MPLPKLGDVTNEPVKEVTEEVKNPVVKPTRSTPQKNLKTSVFITVVTPYTLCEPFTHQIFRSGIPTETSEVTPWLQAQIDAGLMEVS